MMLIKYLKKPSKYVIKFGGKLDQARPYVDVLEGERYGVIVSTGRGKVGWSLCGPHDTFSKEMAKQIASNRSEFYDDLETVNAVAPKKISKEIKEMYNRSLRYYKDETPKEEKTSNSAIAWIKSKLSN